MFYQSLPVIMATQLIAFFALGMYRGLWRAFVAADTMRIVEAIAIGTLLAQVILFVYYGTFPISWLVVTIQAMMLAAAVVASRLIGRAFPPD